MLPNLSHETKVIDCMIELVSEIESEWRGMRVCLAGVHVWEPVHWTCPSHSAGMSRESGGSTVRESG